MASFLGDILRGAASELPRTIDSANEFAQKAQALASQEKAVQVKQQSEQRMQKLQDREIKVQNLRLVLAAASNTNKQQQKAQFKFLVANNAMSEDAAQMHMTASDEEKAELQKRFDDNNYSMDDMIWLSQSKYADLIPLMSKFNSSVVEAQLRSKQGEKVEAETDLIRNTIEARNQSSNVVDMFLGGGNASAEQQPGPTQQPSSAVQNIQGRLNQFRNATDRTLPLSDRISTQGGGSAPQESPLVRQEAPEQQRPIDKEIARLRGVEDALIAETLRGVPNATKKLVPIQKKLRSLIGMKTRNAKLTENERGEKVILDLDKNVSIPVNFGEEGSAVSGIDLIRQIPRTKGSEIINTKQLLTGTGPGAKILSAFNNAFSFLIPNLFLRDGQIAPETAEAKNAIKSFNQTIKQALSINPKNPIAELRTIEGFLIPEKSFFVDPDSSVTNMINIVRRVQSRVIRYQDALNMTGNRRLSKAQALAVREDLNKAMIMLSSMPDIAQLKLNSGRAVLPEDIMMLSKERIRQIPIDFFSVDAAKEAIKILKK